MTAKMQFFLYIGLFAVGFGGMFAIWVPYVSTATLGQLWMWILLGVGLIALGILCFWGIGNEAKKQKNFEKGMKDQRDRVEEYRKLKEEENL